MSKSDKLTSEEAYKKFVKNFDWEGFAAAYQKSENSWHAKEWETFINQIRIAERKFIAQRIDDYMEQESPTGYELMEFIWGLTKDIEKKKAQ